MSHIKYPCVQDWYRTWLCLQEWPVYSGTGERVAACREECRAVQQHCPFLAIHEDASMASGDPSFLCQGHTGTQIMKY